jgi:FAD/FMN-containing dehydrogenase
VARASRDATAYSGREVAHTMSIDAVWLPGQDDTVRAAETAWARAFLDALEPHAHGVYVNFLDADDDARRVRAAYGDHTHRRLAEVKARYDPDNVFRHNKNIPPATPAR